MVMMLVVGVSGGAGTTTTTIGLANSWSARSRCTVAVDATVGGGDLIERAADGFVGSATIEAGYVDAELSSTSAGARVLGRSWLQPTEPDYRSLDWYLHYRHDVRLYDLGHRAFGRDSARPLHSDTTARIVLVAAARSDAPLRLRAALQAICLTAGQKAMARTHVVLTHHAPGAPTTDVGEIESALISRVSSVDEVPFDPHLGTGSVVTAAELDPATAAAFDRIRTRSLGTSWGTMTA